MFGSQSTGQVAFFFFLLITRVLFKLVSLSFLVSLGRKSTLLADALIFGLLFYPLLVDVSFLFSVMMVFLSGGTAILSFLIHMQRRNFVRVLRVHVS